MTLELEGNAQPMLDATRNQHGSQRCYSLETACICMIVSLWVYLCVNTGHTLMNIDDIIICRLNCMMNQCIHSSISIFKRKRIKYDKMSLHVFSSTPVGCTTPHGGAHGAAALHAPPRFYRSGPSKHMPPSFQTSAASAPITAGSVEASAPGRIRIPRTQLGRYRDFIPGLQVRLVRKHMHFD